VRFDIFVICEILLRKELTKTLFFAQEGSTEGLSSFYFP